MDKYGVEDAAESLCEPDGEVAEIGLENNSELILDMGIGNELVDDEGGDFYFYEFPNEPGIHLDRTEVAVALDDGNGQPGNFIVVFVWGDDDPSNNGTILPKYLPEKPNRRILASDLHNGTGIGIDIGRDDEARYRFIRIITYPSSEIPPRDERAQVDAIEKANFTMIPTPTPTPIPSPTFEPTYTPAPTDTATPTTTPTPTDTPIPPTATPVEPTVTPVQPTATPTPTAMPIPH